ncbi:MAG: amidase family protein [Candidatus Berkiella sp.]
MEIQSFQEISIKAILNGYQYNQWQPHDIIAICEKAYQRYEPTTQAWVCFDALKMDQQVQKSCKSDRKEYRKLEGIPVGIKDIINTEDFPTQMGSPLWEAFTPGNDARLVSSLKLDGAIIPGKTDTAEFAVHSLNKTMNPHGAEYSPGTSSSGSAAAVATGMVPCALGSQTAGSIIRPASYCGVFAMKPSYGLLPRTGILKTTDTLDSMGFFTYFAEDLRIMLDVLCVKGRNYPFSTKLYQQKDYQKIKLGLIAPNRHVANAPYAVTELQHWLNKLKINSSVDISLVELPESTSQVHDWHRIIYHKSLAYYFAKEYQDKSLISDEMKECIEDGLAISKSQYQEGLRFQAEYAQDIDIIFQKYDALVCLSTYGEAVKRHEKEIRDLCLLWTLSYVPALNIPLFKSPNGLPFGMQLVGRRYHDFDLLNVLHFLIENHLVQSSSTAIVRQYEQHIVQQELSYT